MNAIKSKEDFNFKEFTPDIPFINENKDILLGLIIENLGNSTKKFNQIYKEINDVSVIHDLDNKQLVELDQLEIYNKMLQLYEFRYNIDNIFCDHLMEADNSRNKLNEIFYDNYKYHMQNYKSFEKIFTCQLIVKTKNVIVYNAKLNQFIMITIEDLPDVLNFFISVEIDSTGNIMYLVGGQFGNIDSCEPSKQLYIYNINEKLLTKGKELINERNSPLLCLHEDILYIMSGLDVEDEIISVNEQYDILNNEISNIASFPIEFRYTSICVLNNILYLFGDSKDGAQLISLNLKSSKSDWEIIKINIDTNDEYIFSSVLAAVSSDSLIMFGGHIDNGEEYNEQVILFNLKTNTSTELSSKPTTRALFSGTPAIYKFMIFAIDFDNEKGTPNNCMHTYDCNSKVFMCFEIMAKEFKNNNN